MCAIKSPGQTSSRKPIKAKERCTRNLNEAYSGDGGEEMGLHLSDDAANLEDDKDNHFNSPPPFNLLGMEVGGLPKLS